MHVMVGETRSKWNMAILKREGMGRMWQKNTPTPRDGERWGFDCDAYGLCRIYSSIPWLKEQGCNCFKSVVLAALAE